MQTPSDVNAVPDPDKGTGPYASGELLWGQPMLDAVTGQE